MKNILHLKAPGNWINDPNGFIYYQGRYHLFYQCFPYAPVWGTMHWGHAVSEDLVHWEHLDIAVFPTKRYDSNGVFSGSALEKDGRLYLYYSAVRYLEEEEENIHIPVQDVYETSQAVMVSEDGFQFDNWNGKRQIIPVIRDEQIADAGHTRDPKVWYDSGSYYMVLGSTFREKEGRAVFFRSRDGEHWQYAAQYRNPSFGRILECPDLFRLGDRYVFVGSAMYTEDAENGYEHQSVTALAEFDSRTCTMEISSEFQYVDYGMDLYAPQTNVDREGRRVLIGWMRMPEAVKEEGKKDWNGMMSLPRVVEIAGEHIYFRIHPEVEKYFSAEKEDKRHLDPGMPCRIKTTLSEGEYLEIGGYRIWVENGSVKTDRSRVFAGTDGRAAVCGTPTSLEHCGLDIFVEPNLIEVFINDGEYVISNVVYGLGNRITGYVEHVYTG